MSTLSAAESNIPAVEVITDCASSNQARNVLMGLFDSASTASRTYLLSVARSLVVEDTIAALSKAQPAAEQQLRLIRGGTLCG